MTANDAQRRQWSDPETVANWEKRERLTERVSKHVLVAAQLQPGEKVLEIGSGGGKLALMAARQVLPSGRVTGADISPGMVELATARLETSKQKNVAFHLVDCQSETVPGGPFDVVLSQFGVMFFEDPVAAFTNIRGMLKRGARLAFACWQTMDRNTWFPGPVLAPFLATPPTPRPDGVPPSPGPFAFADPGYVRGILQQAGFMGIDRTAKTVTVKAPRDSIADASMVGMMNIAPEKREDALQATYDYLEPMRLPESDLYRFELRIQVFTAHANHK